MPRVNHSPVGEGAGGSWFGGSTETLGRATSETELVVRTGSSVGSFSSAFTMDADLRHPWSSGFPNNPPDDILTINIGGFQYQTRASTLARIPKSLLADPKRRDAFYDAGTKSYFFDRNRLAFDSILEYYRTGKIVQPTTVPIHVFVREMLFFDLGDEMIHKFLRAEELHDEPEILPTNKVQLLVYDLFNCPDSSIFARAIAIFDICMVLTAIIALCVISLQAFQDVVPVGDFGNETVQHRKFEYKVNAFSNPFFVVDVICNSWFIFDIVVRFAASPEKRLFFCNFMAIVDVLSITPFLEDVIVTATTNGRSSGPSINFLLAFRILRLFRVFKVLKMDDYSDGLKVLTQTLRSAKKELGIMVLFLVVGAIFFSTTMYYAERETTNTDYTSIPASFWWAVITWTTIGYGDIYPKTPGGKVVGCICAITGVLALGMIIPPVVRRFEHYFYRAQNMVELELVFREHYASRKSAKPGGLEGRYTKRTSSLKDFFAIT
ncbi:Potassium voltage-gated channel subfamily A member 1 [Hypsibius exemplaris]|uniref:Potassium voltage-gated channel subfamily A member 1 n=1 Tax=Hypsibius exemplaris TaxID=2072580 RepID=A0A1W0WLI1_HYPEX|nr:Potassium voltage-gated channel subfamily A member 1 [Hypsibius exemplaris]